MGSSISLLFIYPSRQEKTKAKKIYGSIKKLGMPIVYEHYK